MKEIIKLKQIFELVLPEEDYSIDEEFNMGFKSCRDKIEKRMNQYLKTLESEK